MKILIAIALVIVLEALLVMVFRALQTYNSKFPD